MTIGDRIKYLREKHQMTQDEIAQKLNTKSQTIYKYEKNIVTNIPISNIEKLSQLFDVSPCYLVGWSSDDKQNSSLDTKEEEILEIFRKLNEEKQNKVIGYAEAQLNDNDNVYYIGYNAAMGGERTETIHTKEELVSAHDKLRARLKKKKEEK